MKYRPRRTLVVKLTDGERDLWVRFLNFYPSQVKQFTPGKRVRLFGEVRPGFFGDEMVHPRYRVVEKGAPLPKSLTPVYPTTAGLSQNAACARRSTRALDTLALDDTLDATLLATTLKLRPLPRERAAAAPPAARTSDARERSRSARTRRGGASSSTSSSRSSWRCASPTASAARRSAPAAARRRTRSPTRW